MATTATKLQAAKTALPDGGMFASPEKRYAVLTLLLILATLILYNPVTGNSFINCDDDRYITENPYIRNGLNWQTLKWALTSTGQGGFWHPLTWVSHALDIQLFHFNPAGHHFVSLLIHSLNAALVFLLLAYATKRLGASVLFAALFALHPLNVESVAWAAERKNVLSTFFFFAAVGAYGWYTAHPNWKRYLAIAGLFVCGLASKPMVVTLPFVLLLLDYWPLQRFGRSELSALSVEVVAKPLSFSAAVVEKLPLLFLSGLASLITVFAQKAAGATRQLPLSVRLENAVVAYATYLQKLMWPSHLTPVYPHPGDSLAVWQIMLSGAVLLAITGSALLSSRKYLIVGWLWFLGILFPTIGLIQVGDQAMADRFAYIPELGIFVMIVWTLADFLDTRKISLTWRLVPSFLVLAALAAVTHRQIAYWHSSYSLWSHAVQVTKNNFIAEDNLGGALLLMGKEEEAYPHFEAAAEINPRDPLSHSNLGTYAQSHGNLQKAVMQYQTTLAVTSDAGLLAQTYANLGMAQRSLGEDVEARNSFDQSLRLNSHQYNAWLGLGLLAEKEGKAQEAILDLSRSVELQPTAEGYLQLGRVFAQANRRAEALAAYEQALKVSPDMAEAQGALEALRQQR
ncbi:MAG: tetratricopeptide repeat protein [Candidatus Sulfotelmatobacter sp.]